MKFSENTVSLGKIHDTTIDLSIFAIQYLFLGLGLLRNFPKSICETLKFAKYNDNNFKIDSEIGINLQ